METDSRIRFSDKIVLLILYVFLLSESVSGPIRYISVGLSIESIIYVPKIFLLGVVLFKITKAVLLKRFEVVFFISLLLITLQTGIGFLFLRNSTQIIFGIWVIVPLLFGLAIYHSFIISWDIISYKPFLVLWATAIIGVFLQILVGFPWEGLQYSLAGANITANKLWWLSGVQRFSGFSRSSNYVGAEITLIGLILISKFKGSRWSLAIIIFSTAALWLTRSSAWFLTWAFLIMFITLRSYIPTRIKQISPFLVALMGLILPISSFFLKPQLENQAFLFSLGQRLAKTWPQAFDLVFKHGNIFFGRGIGGLGAPQNYYESFLHNPGDNLFISVYVLFGILGILILLAFSIELGNSLIIHSISATWTIYVIGLALLLLGLTANGLESPLDSICLGICLGSIFNNSYLYRKRGHAYNER